MLNDSIANTYLTPGLFAALCEGSNDDKKEATDLMIKVKQSAYQNMSERLESVVHKYMTLLTFTSEELSRAETLRQRGDLKSPVSGAWGSQSKDSRLVSTALSTHRMADDSSSGPGNTGRWSATSKVDQRASSSNQGRKKSDANQKKMSDKELKSFLREKDDLMNLYPQLKDIESSRLSAYLDNTIKEEVDEDEFAYARPPKAFNKTASGFRVKENNTASRKVTTGNKNRRQTETQTDLEPIKIEPPKYVRPSSNDYRISKRSKSSVGNRPTVQKQEGKRAKVSPYAQPLPNQEERRRRLLKMLQ